MSCYFGSLVQFDIFDARMSALANALSHTNRPDLMLTVATASLNRYATPASHNKLLFPFAESLKCLPSLDHIVPKHL